VESIYLTVLTVITKNTAAMTTSTRLYLFTVLRLWLMCRAAGHLVRETAAG